MEVLSRCAGHDDYKIMSSLTICLKRETKSVCLERERVCASVCERERKRYGWERERERVGVY